MNADNSTPAVAKPLEDMSMEEHESYLKEQAETSEAEPAESTEETPTEEQSQQEEGKPQETTDEEGRSDNPKGPDLKEILPEQFKGDPTKFVKSYNELRSEFTRTRQEMAELKRLSDETRADQLRKAQEEEQRNRELYMSDEEKELIELQKKIVEPVLQPYKEELERLKQERVSEDRTQKERQRVMTDQSIYAKFIEATPVAKTVEKQFWYLAQQEGSPPDYLQEDLPAEYQGKDYREIPYPVLFNAFYGPAIKTGKEEAFTKMEDKAKTQPLGGKPASPDRKSTKWEDLSLEDHEKLLGYSDR